MAEESEGIKLFGAMIRLKSEEVKKGSEYERVEKRRQKIIACPRCKSMETKFCYFNNYNVNQPRHFCKSCQRYWTAGGALRNVAVGAGRRKAKSPCHVFSDGRVYETSQQDDNKFEMEQRLRLDDHHVSMPHTKVSMKVNKISYKYEEHGIMYGQEKTSEMRNQSKRVF